MDIPSAAIFYLADQVGVSQEMWFEYPWEGRAIWDYVLLSIDLAWSGTWCNSAN